MMKPMTKPLMKQNVILMVDSPHLSVGNVVRNCCLVSALSPFQRAEDMTSRLHDLVLVMNVETKRVAVDMEKIPSACSLVGARTYVQILAESTEDGV